MPIVATGTPACPVSWREKRSGKQPSEYERSCVTDVGRWRFLKETPKVLGGNDGGEGYTGARNGQGEDLRIGQGGRDEQ